MTVFKKYAAMLAATVLLSPTGVQADWNQGNDEANRQRIMNDMRQTQANNDRANSDAQFKSQLQRQPSSSPSSGDRSSGGGNGSSPNYAPSGGGDTDTGRRSVVSTTTFTVGAAPTPAQFFARTSREAAQGDSEAQFNLGKMYYSGYGTGRDDPQARRWLGEAAKQGHIVAAALHASVLRYGVGGPVDMDAARQSYAVAAKGGDARAMAELGMMYSQGTGGLTKNDAEALRLWKASAAKGDSSAAYALGLANINGMLGLTPNPKEGLRLVKSSAENGDLNGMSLYAAVLNEGAIVPKDLAGAVRYARAAAEAGDGYGQSMMAVFAYQGDGVPKSHEEAFRWAKLSADGGNADGQLTLGTLYYFGHGTPVNIREAARLFQLAAAKGNAMAISNMKEPDIIEAAKGL